MASENALSKLAKKPLGVQLAVLGGILVALVVGYWQVVNSGIHEETQGAIGRKKSVAKKMEELRKDKTTLETLRRERADRKREIEKGLHKLPAVSELPGFLKQLQNQAGTAGVKVKNYAQQNEIMVDDFIKVPYKLEATGTFYQLARYFWLLWEYSKSDAGLIITIENIKLGDAKVDIDGIVLTAEFLASTFRQAEQVEAAPAEDAKGKAGAKAKAGKGKDAKDEGAAGDKPEAGKPAGDKPEAGTSNPGAEKSK